MDARHFDALTRVLTGEGSRRRLVALLATLPVLGGVFGIFAADDAGGKGRRKRRVKRHKHGGRRKNRKRKQQRKCTPDSTAQTCAGTCGSVTNNCKQAVDCGSCACDPPCAACLVCQDGPNTPGACVADPQQRGDACGDPGQVCQADGACACDGTSCPNCTTCGSDGQCAACADCCDASGVCQAGDTNAACGGSGTCDVCTGQEQCQGQTCVCVAACSGKNCGPDGCGGSCGSCTAPQTCGGGNPGTPGVCGCTPTTCMAQGKDCGSIPDGCGVSLDCGTCTAPKTCGGATPSEANVCGCTPTTCAAQGKTCGTISDGCGGTLECGVCSGGCCQSDNTCGATCRVFVANPGSWSGLSGGDAVCQNTAAGAGLKGRFMAWLSDGTNSPSTRFPLAGSTTAGPYVLPGSPLATVATDWTDLITCAGSVCLGHPINRNASGTTGGVFSEVGTGTRSDGTSFPEGQTCAGWRGGGEGAAGRVNETSANWTQSNNSNCVFISQLYCFQQG